ncbi:MAG: periplasmic solute binding protein [Paucimonas sp.]|nr:periplasmic solute binding protein [Paucimonas sp.]
MHRLLLMLALWAAVLPTAFAAPLQVAATTTDLKALVEEVGGDMVQVQALTSPLQDPHAAEIKPAQLALARRAELVVRIGLDHEPWFSRLGLPARTPVLDASRHARLLQTETPRLRLESRSHTHALGNTHYWLDPFNAIPITEGIEQSLSRLRPADALRFKANREAFVRRLRERIERWQQEMAPLRGLKVVVVHDSWTYFADRFGLTILATAEPMPGVPPSPQELSALVDRMKQAKVKLILADPHANPALLRLLASRTGARPVTLLPSAGAESAGSGYLDLFNHNIRRLTEALH